MLKKCVLIAALMLVRRTRQARARTGCFTPNIGVGFGGDAPATTS